MKVSELAKELNTTSAVILATLKSLRLKAKDNEQVLNSAVVSVVRSEISKANKASVPKIKPEVKKEKEKQEQQATQGEVNAAKEKNVKVKIETKHEIPVPAVPKTVKAKTEITQSMGSKGVAKVKEVIFSKKKTRSVVKEEIFFKPQEKPGPTQKISNEPFVTLKPLAKRRKKGSPSSRDILKVSDVHLTGESLKESIPAKSSGMATFVETERETPKAIHKATGVIPIPSRPTEVEPESVEELPTLEIKVPISVKDFSVKVQQKPSGVLKALMQMGFLATINQSLEEDVVKKLANQFGFNITKVKTDEEQLIEKHLEEEEDLSLLKSRAPVVTFMGHVDHGKTSLLDRIRKSKIVDTEHGGITQHIGAYSVELPKGRITFLDTPGHEAFTAMRARGAHITDLVVLVVAADEGIMPQTDEAINHAIAAGVPIVVALNKIDRKTADVERVKKQLSERNLLPEDWGGKTVTVGVSALTGDGIDRLLEMILLEAELLELKTNYEKKASGVVIDAHLSRGQGVVVTLIVQSGILRFNDIVVVGSYYGKIKAMFDDRERSIKEAGPSMPIEILGLSNVPEAGDVFYVLEDERQAREIALRRQEQIKNQKLSATQQRISLEDLYTRIKEGTIKELNVILKADVQGSLEALRD